MRKMIMMVIFSIKLVSVASVCVTQSSGTSGDCSDRSASSSFDLYINQGLTQGGRLIYESTLNYSTLSKCANYCENDGACEYFDYDCQTGNCVTYSYNYFGSGADVSQLFS